MRPISLLLLTTLLSLAAVAAETQSHRQHAFGHGGPRGLHPIIEQFVEEKFAAGELDVSGYNALKERRQTLRAEIRDLRASSDEAGLQAKRQEMSQLRQEHRALVQQLMAGHPELKERIRAWRQAVGPRHAGHPRRSRPAQPL